MKVSPIDIKRNNSMLENAIWPSAYVTVPTIESKLELVIESENNVTVLNASAHLGPKCQDGVCQLGDWKPTRKAA
jgi:hypothetical protein